MRQFFTAESSADGTFEGDSIVSLPSFFLGFSGIVDQLFVVVKFFLVKDSLQILGHVEDCCELWGVPEVWFKILD